VAGRSVLADALPGLPEDVHGTVKLDIRVQHHPARAYLLDSLLPQLPESTVVVSADADAARNPWREYRRCLESISDKATHVLVLQDDTILCRHFPEVAVKAVKAKPGAVVCFCVCGEPYEAASALVGAAHSGQNWVALLSARWVPAIATAWPREAIGPALEFVDAQNWPAVFCSDDEIAGHIVRHLELEVWATVPSLVDHDYRQPSVLKKHPIGADPARCAACFIDPNCDPHTIDWADG
jgi:hypothetical protein